MIVVGRVGRPHGLDGSFFVESPSEDPARFAKGAALWVAGEKLRIVGSKQARGRPVIRLERRVPRGSALEVPREALPPPPEDAYYVFQLVGLEVEDEAGAKLGRVEEVAPGVANDVLELDTGLALPLVEACVLDIDVDAGRIVVARGFSSPG